MRFFKHLMLLTVSLLLAFLLPNLYAESSNIAIPAPFGKVKEIAMRATPDADGDYITEIIFNEDGRKTSYAFMYCPKEKMILLGRSGFGSIIIIIYEETTGEFFTIQNNFIIQIDKDIAITEAFKIFRELTQRKMT